MTEDDRCAAWLASRGVGTETVDLSRRTQVNVRLYLDEMRERLRAKRAEAMERDRLSTTITTNGTAPVGQTPPRYDAVFTDGMAWRGVARQDRA